jgi:hypothetical protein
MLRRRLLFLQEVLHLHQRHLRRPSRRVVRLLPLPSLQSATPDISLKYQARRHCQNLQAEWWMYLQESERPAVLVVAD